MKATILPTLFFATLILLSSCGSSNKMINCYSFSNGKKSKNHFPKLDYSHRKVKKKKKTTNRNQLNSLQIDAEKKPVPKNSMIHPPTKALSSIATKSNYLLASTNNTPFSFSKIKPISKIDKKLKKKYSTSVSKRKIATNLKFYKNEKIQKRSVLINGNDNMFILNSAMIGLIMAALFWFNRFKLQRISFWAAKNNKKAIVAIGSIKTFLMLSGLFIGSYLAEQELAFSNSTSNILIGSYLTAALFYPAKNSLARFFEASNFRQKINDFALVLSGFLIMICLGNKSTVNPDFSAPSNFIFQTYDNFSTGTFDNTTVFQNNNDQISSSKNSVSSSKNSQLSNGAKAGLTILAILIFLVLMGLVSYIACGLSCNGQEALALLVGLGGITGLVTGLIFVLKSIYKKS